MLIPSLILIVGCAVALPTNQIEEKCVPNCSCSSNKGVLTVKACSGVLTLDNVSFKDVEKKAIETIQVDTKYINVIDKNVFEGFEILQNVVIKNANIGTMHPNAFVNATTVNFENCRFEDNPEISSKRLAELKFIKCALAEIPNLDCYGLRYLNLSSNAFKTIDVMSFARLLALEEIDLSNNEISKFPGNMFVNNLELNTLYMDNNPLKEFAINTTNNLEQLSLKGCQLKKFDDQATKYLDDLTTLSLNDNQIETIEGVHMAHMINLEVFDISNNKLMKINPDIFENNTRLEIITLDGNDIKALPLFVSAYNQKFETFKFSCRRCGLSQTPHPLTFKKFSALRELYLSENYLTNLDNSFDFLTNLKILDLSHNRLYDISPTTFQKLEKLDTLYLSDNKLSIIDPKVFIKNGKLLVLDVSNNSLVKLWKDDTDQVKSLEKFIVRNNKIKKITQDDLKIMPNLKTFDIDENSLECNQDLIDALLWLRINLVYSTQYTTHMAMKDEQLDGFEEYSWNEIIQDRCPNFDAMIQQLEKAVQEEENDDDDEEDDSFDEHDKDDDEKDIDNEETINIDDDSSPVPKKHDKYEEAIYEDYSYEDALDGVPSKPTRDDLRQQAVEEIADIHYAYIFSVSMVFILTALLVLCVAVTVILLVLKKNGTFNMHKANLPRFKIQGLRNSNVLKKHDGSIYRPLSEEAQTPQPRRYEFPNQPTVHSNQP